MAETLGFQTEVNQLLHLVVHSLYSNKEIFLRELISNASDACDKLRFLAIANSSLYENDPDLKITVDMNSDTKTITITDNGIGMSKEDAISHLGTIAKSGTKEFLSQLTGDQAKDSHLIGQFGVGFYSAFIVADKVIVKSRKAGAPSHEGVVWSSTGEGGYEIETIDKPTRGTEITLHIKPSESDFLSEWKIRSIITRYSDHISWPILMKKPENFAKEGEEQPAQAPEFEPVNRAKALWTLNKQDIKDEEYQELYKHISHDYENPMTWTHNQVEGKLNYISLLYIPARAPFDLWQQESKHGLKLFVKRVFILDDATQFLPRYLRFVRGIIDSDDLPLNVSRELLQENKNIETIRSSCVKRVLGLLEKLAEDKPEEYAKFWQEFGLVMKEGPIEDFANREKVAKLLRFSSTHTDSKEQNVTLDDYLARMKEGQDKIYYITASSFNAAKNSPHLEIFRQKGIEVLLLSDRIDEWLVGHLAEYAGKKLQSVTKGELELPEGEKPADEKKADGESHPERDSVINHVKSVLGERVKEVRLTHRLTSSPACIVADEKDMGLEMARILKMAGQDIPEVKPIFELNPEHALFAKLSQETDDDRFADWTQILFDQALLAEGGQLDDPASFVQRLNRLLVEA